MLRIAIVCLLLLCFLSLGCRVKTTTTPHITTPKAMIAPPAGNGDVWICSVSSVWPIPQTGWSELLSDNYCPGTKQSIDGMTQPVVAAGYWFYDLHSQQNDLIIHVYGDPKNMKENNEVLQAYRHSANWHVFAVGPGMGNFTDASTQSQPTTSRKS